jgi:BMFP domain-containing protein YqiC
MTQSSNRIFDEMARLMGDAASVAQGVKREAETAFRSQMERIVADLDLVKREDFDAVREMASKARAENEELRKRIEALEGMLGERTP